MWASLKRKIKAILEANTLFQEVYDYEAQEFGGDPVVTFQPSVNEADYRTTTENRRIVAFSVQMWVKRGEPSYDKKVEDTLTDLVDSVLDDFDKYYTLGTGSPGAALSLPAGYTMIRTEAMPSTWYYVNRDTWYRVAEIVIRCHLDVDVTTIT